jgi:hypothetical protein
MMTIKPQRGWEYHPEFSAELEDLLTGKIHVFTRLSARMRDNCPPRCPIRDGQGRVRAFVTLYDGGYFAVFYVNKRKRPGWVGLKLFMEHDCDTLPDDAYDSASVRLKDLDD